MREIKFRGWFQCITGREYWVYGYPSKQDNGNWEITNDAGISFTVEKPEQYTGLKDADGRDIYEGDILEFRNTLGLLKKHKVFRVNGGLVINSHSDDINKDINPFYDACADMQTSQWIEQCTVIGNIHENPELLKQ